MLKDIVFAGQVLDYPANSTILREGEPAAGMHMLLRGQVYLYKVGLQGIESIVYVVKSVVMFNETTVIDGQPNPVTAIAERECTTWQVSPARYQMLMRRYPEVGIGFPNHRIAALAATVPEAISRSI